MKIISVIYQVQLFGLFIPLLFSCKKESIKVIPTVIISSVTTGATSASCMGEITSDGGSAVTERGFCWATSLNPTTSNNKTTDVYAVMGRPRVFIGGPNGLTPGTNYYVRAYATNNIGTGYSNQESFQTDNEILTFDGDVYHSVTIGTQVWMVENLKTTKYQNGDPISNVIDGAAWSALTVGAYCCYNNDAATYKATYGALYNWYAVSDSRNIAPTGWHVASDAEWTILITYLGGESIAGGKMKEIGLTHWVNPNVGANNSSGFTALPAGFRAGSIGSNGIFDYFGGHNYFWSNIADAISTAWSRDLSYNDAKVVRYSYDKRDGFSVRCVKD